VRYRKLHGKKFWATWAKKGDDIKMHFEKTVCGDMKRNGLPQHMR
jgi:hypothetical protein